MKPEQLIRIVMNELHPVGWFFRYAWNLDQKSLCFPSRIKFSSLKKSTAIDCSFSFGLSKWNRIQEPERLQNVNQIRIVTAQLVFFLQHIHKIPTKA
jgi:hypothetical protein